MDWVFLVISLLLFYELFCIQIWLKRVFHELSHLKKIVSDGNEARNKLVQEADRQTYWAHETYKKL